MENKELKELIKKIQLEKAEGQTIELKAAKKGSPTHIHNTLSSFSNQNEGGVILFGIDEEDNFNICGVYDAQDLQKKISSQGKEMEPIVTPVYTVDSINNKVIVSAEIPPLSYSDRPCFKKSAGISQGSYKRIGDEDIKMSSEEIFDYYVFRHSLHIDSEPITDNREFLDKKRLETFIEKAKSGKRNFGNVFSEEEILNMLNVRNNSYLTKAGALIFSKYPQMYFPQLSIHAVAYPGNNIGDLGEINERFIDSQNITGSIPDMLELAMKFIRRNIREKVIIIDGERKDKFEYPLTALREAILNALIHRDYSNLSERKPIRLEIFKNRIEIISPGGLFGNSDISELGKTSLATRNENIVNILEILDICENRYSGIPTMRKEMELYNLPEPQFINRNNSFKVIFYNESKNSEAVESEILTNSSKTPKSEEDILEFCKVPRSRKELKNFFGTTSNSIFSRRILPLIKKNKLSFTIPEHPKSPKQHYLTIT